MLSHTYRADTLNQLHTDMCLDLLYAPADQLDTISMIDVSKHNVVGIADSMEWEFDLKNLWLSKSRWNMMVRQYLDPDQLVAWFAACQKIGRKKRGQAVLRTRTVKSQGGEANGFTNKERRRWGSCMLAITYKAVPTPTITLHSRTSYLGYLSNLDVTVAHVLGQYVSDMVGVPLSEFHFVWMLESAQWHSFKSLAWVLVNPDDDIREQGRRVLLKKAVNLSPDEQELMTSPAVKGSRVWLNKVRREDAQGITYGDMNYNTYRRIRRRWHTEIFGYEKAQSFEGWSLWVGGDKDGEPKEYFPAYHPLPSVSSTGLDLAALKLFRTGPKAFKWPRDFSDVELYDEFLLEHAEDGDYAE